MVAIREGIAVRTMVEITVVSIPWQTLVSPRRRLTRIAFQASSFSQGSLLVDRMIHSERE